MRRAKLLLLLGTCLAVTATMAQVPDTVWTKRFGGNDRDVMMTLVRADGPEMLMAGYTRSFGSGQADAWIIKLDPNSDTMWTRVYGGSSDDVALAIVPTMEGMFVAGRTASFGGGGEDMYLLKCNPEGETLWTKTFGGSGDEAAYGVAKTMDNGAVLAGYKNGGANADLWMLRTDPEGETLWTKTFGGTGIQEAHAAISTMDGGYAIAGRKGGDGWLLVFNPEGETLWTRSLGGTREDAFNAVATTPDMSFLAAGITKSSGAGASNAWVAKFNNRGDTAWTRSIGTDAAEEVRACYPTMDEGAILVGTSISAAGGDTGVFVAKLDAQGNPEWFGTYGDSTNPEMAYGVVQADDQHFIFAGMVGGTGGDAWLVKIRPFISGIIGRTPEVLERPGLRVGPNLVSGNAGISFELPRAAQVRLVVYDLLGQEVRTLASGSHAAGTHRATWDRTDATGSQVADGLYFVRLDADDMTCTGKLLLER